MLIRTITAHQIVIQPAIGTASVQKLRTVFAADSSLAMVMQKENQYDQPSAKPAAGSTNLPRFRNATSANSERDT